MVFGHASAKISRIIQQNCVDFGKCAGTLSAMLQTRTDVKAVPCERCRIIRSFIMFVIMLVLLALVAGDKLAYLNFLNAEFFATMIMVIGGVGFIVKLAFWKFISRSDTETD
jgi:disulfide bond formation protein DsbB